MPQRTSDNACFFFLLFTLFNDILETTTKREASRVYLYARSRVNIIPGLEPDVIMFCLGVDEYDMRFRV